MISCLKTLIGPPGRADSGLHLSSVLRNLGPDQLEVRFCGFFLGVC